MTCAADDQRAVGLLGGRAAYRRIGTQLQQLAMRRDRIELQFAAAVRCRHARPFGEQLDHAARKTVERKRIGQEADAPAAAYTRQRQLLRQRTGDRVLGNEAERQQVAVGAARHLHFDLRQQYRRLDAGHVGDLRDPRTLEHLVLAGEPAALGQVRRQHLAFEHAARMGSASSSSSELRTTSVCIRAASAAPA